MKIDYERMTDCLWDKNLKFEILDALFTKPSQPIRFLDDIMAFWWRNFFGSLCVLAVYICGEDIFTSHPAEVRGFVKHNWAVLLERWSQITGINEITDNMLSEAKREKNEANVSK